MEYAPIGTVSQATMRCEDLIPVFVECLEALDTEKIYTDVINEGKNIIKNELWEDEDTEIYLNEDLWDSLDNFAPPYCYFGSHFGDCSDFGFWPSFDCIEYDYKGLKVNDLSEIPDNYSGEVFLINDHGNISFYTSENGKYTEIWSIV